MTPQGAAAEALCIWTAAQALERVDDRWAPRLLSRFAAVVREVIERAPEAARRAGLVHIARALLRGDPEVSRALCRDAALGRWTAGTEDALSRGAALEVWLALAPRFGLAAALRAEADLETTIVLGSGGRARIPADGRVLQGPPGRPLGGAVSGGELDTHSRAPRRAGAFEVADGDAEAGAAPAVQPLSGGSLPDIVHPLAEGAACLAASDPALAAEVAALAPVLVGVSGAAEVSHSASLASARGCIWLTPVSRPLVVAETLVHEASHLKFFLVEDAAPLVDAVDPPRFEVPWRADQRPLRAVLMGLHAWVRVLDWLEGFSGGELAQPAGERVAILLEATRAAAGIVAGADGLTPAGEALVDALCERVQGR